LLGIVIDRVKLIAEVMTFELHKVIKKSADNFRTIVEFVERNFRAYNLL